jgi:hypothetical protein
MPTDLPADPMPGISFCVTCRNRLWQLESTLPDNLAALGDRHEISLVDFGSTDGLAAWVWDRFRPAIERGRLVFFEVTSEVRWSSPRAKNLAHRVAGGSYLFNLDADNRIGPADVALVEQAAARGEAVHQWAGNWTDGSFGRIGLPRDLYHTLGGYDESMLPMAGQDMDLLRRIHGSGRTIVRLAPPAMPAVQNTFEHKMAEVGPPAPVRAGRLSAVPRHQPDAVPGPVRPRRPAPAGGFASYRGRLNGAPRAHRRIRQRVPDRRLTCLYPAT